ncbi:MAG: PDZ domain-containing protein, partial [Planctomycetaceae bacterium]
LRQDRVTVYGVRTAAGLRQLASLANRDTRLSLDFDATQRQDSDHWTFYRRRIPYLMFHTGDHDDYHRPSDDAHKLNYGGLEQLTRLIFETAHSAAGIATLAAFRSEVVRERLGESSETGSPKPPRLGVSWNTDRGPAEPFRITRVVPDSPAAQAGLMAGDQIVRINGQPASEIDDLAAVVLAAPERSVLIIEREGKLTPLEVPVTFGGSPVRLGVQWRTDSSEPESVIVTGVVAGSPAAGAGLAVGDRLSSTDPSELPPGEWLQSATAASHLRLSLRLERTGVLQDVVIDLLPVAD